MIVFLVCAFVVLVLWFVWSPCDAAGWSDEWAEAQRWARQSAERDA